MDLSYDLEKEKIVSEIRKHDAKLVVLHLPDGLKPKAIDIQREIKDKTNAKVLIWCGSNFGACDLPVDVERAGADLVLHFGHSAWLS